eukprot:Nitzschia sp. Nitz4//scaffold21_size171442//2009//3931//NITZ4_002136-RA/size171442-processed-gene-0.0-mRNA-1//1//CDS//3329542336//6691//frame0
MEDNCAVQWTQLKVYNSLSGKVEALPVSCGKRGLAWYTCGPTTYAPAHLGHARTYVWSDILRRLIQAEVAQSSYTSPPPLFVMNITDVDDKILAASQEQDLDPVQLARKYEAEFWNDLQSLNCLMPNVVTRVTEHVDTVIVPYIDKLVQTGMAYETEEGVYFHVRAFDEQMGRVTRYGKLAPPAASVDWKLTLGQNGSDERKGSTSSKKDPRDFALWKRKKVNEGLSWPSPWGEGRPGWHIECSAMIEAVQSRFSSTHQFSVHAGGVDLQFPHHTNEIAQAEAYLQKGEWIPHWIHTGHLHIDGLKMSKSLKNFVSIQDFWDQYGDLSDPSSLESPSDDFRLWCLGISGSYRGPATYSSDRIEEARNVRTKIVRFLLAGEEWIAAASDISSGRRSWNDDDFTLFSSNHEIRTKCMEALRNDLDGTKFFQQLMFLVEVGNMHISKAPEGRPPEPLEAVVDSIRELLSLVGFTEKTTKVCKAALGASELGTSSSAVMDAIVKFRSDIRHAALEDVKSKEASEKVKQILQWCDELRDSVLPKLGVQLLDGKAAEEVDSWRPCLPTTEDATTEGHESKAPPAQVNLLDIPLQDYFRCGQYEGQFSAFTELGIPTHNADGSEVSKRLLKKLLKKRDAHKARLGNK